LDQPGRLGCGAELSPLAQVFAYKIKDGAFREEHE
jgi:hypothetical protein